MAVAVLITASVSPLLAQALASPDKSFYLGKLVERPEALSGLWEAPDGHGGVVGIHLRLDATIPADATSFKGVPQSWVDLQVGVFDRRGPEEQADEEIGFSDSPRGGGVRFENGRLTLHWVSKYSDGPSIDLNLVKRPGDIWVGRFHRGAFDASVTLRRPTVAKPNPIDGTWLSPPELGPVSVCMHVAEVASGEFTGWSDSLVIPGKAEMAPHGAGPTLAFQRYGELMKVRPEGGRKFSFELYAYTGICCAHTFEGTLQRQGARMDGVWPPGANQSPHRASFKKMSGDSCISELNSRGRRE